MRTIPIPNHINDSRPDCIRVNMGPPAGVDEQDCGTAEMLVSQPS